MTVGLSRNHRARAMGRTLAAATGMVLLLGAGACGSDAHEAADSRPGQSGGASGSAQVAPSPSDQRGSVLSMPMPSKTPPSLSPSQKKRVAEARKSAILGKVEIKRPLQAPPPVPVKDLQVTNSGDIRKDKATMRVVSARSDLTGQRELAWISGAGESAGNGIECSQRIKLQNNDKAHVRRNLLLCWRVSANKSVYTVTVALNGQPSRSKSVAAIERRWAEMG
ncbi:hypothetical protein ACTOB_006998 [Actinoplanes oblitus]|uniref:Uncharacterized protein n=1 Tax=Actinoplanes oblitus TaxID=3040509 RepID=A0ABY8WAP3_9ACTN|nr:hypothetical protein [Actinoplanes oblitus]WIM94939.1 hypothetical protein ACTOB_006998 [Actinoplanes oblitus]